MLACEALLEVIQATMDAGRSIDQVDRADIDRWITTVGDRLRLQATSSETSPREWACTLLAAVIGQDHAIFLQVGDGAIVVGVNDTYSPIFWPVHGEYCNTTQFLTDETVLQALLVELQQTSVEEVSLFTDGLERLALKFSTKEAHGPFFSTLFGQLRRHPGGLVEALVQPMRDWLCSPSINSKTDDDKTLVLATRRVIETV